jgi:Fe-S cluster assembly protein SufD
MKKIILKPPFSGFLELGRSNSKSLQIIVQKGVKGTIFNQRPLQDLEIILQEGASLDFLDYEEIKKEASHKTNIKASLKAKSELTLHLFSCVKGEQEKSLSLFLEGKEAKATLKSLFFLEEEGKSSFQAKCHHLAPSFATQHIKSLLNDRTLFKFQGEIIVPEKIEGVISSQLNQNLLLSEEAHASSKPYLKIKSEDVKVTHGATFSRLKDDECFYLMSRGLAKEKISSLLAIAFCKEIISSVKLSFLGKMIEERFFHGCIQCGTRA